MLPGAISWKVARVFISFIGRRKMNDQSNQPRAWAVEIGRYLEGWVNVVDTCFGLGVWERSYCLKVGRGGGEWFVGLVGVSGVGGRLEE